MRKVVLSDHALEQLEERRIPPELAVETVSSPDEVVPAGTRWVAQKLIEFEGKSYLVRAVCEDDGSDIIVVTVYRTSKIAKYGRPR